MIATKTTVLLASASNDDTPEVLALKVQLAQMTALLTTITAATSHPTDDAARANKNGKTTVPKAVRTCTVCKD